MKEVGLSEATEDAGASLGIELPFTTTVVTLDISALFREEPVREYSRW